MNPPRLPIIDLKRQYQGTKAEVDAALARVVESGWFMGGPEVKAFEQEFAAYCGAEHCVALANGTSALNLALRAAGVGAGDEVITVAFTLSATLDAVVDLGATPVLVDVDAATYTLDPGLLETKITPRTRAVLPVHVYGHPADMDAVLSVAVARDLPVIADACEAHGALYKGDQVASLGTASCFSFYPTKNLNAFGDAGGVVTNDAALAARLRVLRNHGWEPRFHSTESSMNSRMDEIHAAVLRSRLPHLDSWNDRRRSIARRYEGALAGTSVRAAPYAPWAAPCFYLYVIATPERDSLRKALEAAGISTDIPWPEPLHVQPAFAGLGYGRGSLPVSERLCDEVLSIPMFPEMTEAEVERVCSVLKAFGRRKAPLAAV